MILRDYQMKLQRDIRDALRTHRSALAVSPTGSGKTVTFCDIARQAYQCGKRCYIVVHREELIRQVSKTLTQFSVPHSFISARRHGNIREPIQVCSVNTLVNRTDRIARPDLLIFDEAHHCTAGQWRKIINAWPGVKRIGFTATPERLDGSPLGDVFDSLVMGPTPKQLIASGSLVQPRYHIIPSSLTTIEPTKSGNDYRRADLEEATMQAVGLDGNSIFGDAVKHYSTRIPGMPSIVFTPSIRVADRVTEQFRSVGWRFATLHGGNTDAERIDKTAGLASGKYHGLVTVDLVSEGFDVPVCGAAIMLRKTNSLALWLQQGGRALRQAPSKQFAHIFDHVGNYNRHGPLEQDRIWSLGEKIDRQKERESITGIQTKQCPVCYAAHPPARQCPVCGHVYTARDKDIRIVSGELIEIDGNTDQPVSSLWMKCQCGYIHRKDKRCGQCGHDQQAVERKARKIEEWQCNSVQELAALAEARGYKNPWGWAQVRWKSVKSKNQRKTTKQLQLL